MLITTKYYHLISNYSCSMPIPRFKLLTLFNIWIIILWIIIFLLIFDRHCKHERIVKWLYWLWMYWFCLILSRLQGIIHKNVMNIFIFYLIVWSNLRFIIIIVVGLFQLSAVFLWSNRINRMFTLLLNINCF